MNNMKIEINKDQPLDEVVRELERLGYHKVDFDVDYEPSMVIAFADSEMHAYYAFDESLWKYETATLDELKEMK